MVLKNRNPIWQECGFIRVTPEEVRNKESLRLTVLDADRYSIDDELSKVEVPLEALMDAAFHRKGRDAQIMFETQTRSLQPMKRSDKAQGRLRFSVAFFPLSLPKPDEEAALDPRNDSKEHASNASDDKQRQDEVAVSSSELQTQMTGFDRFASLLGFPEDTELLQQRLTRQKRIKKLVGMIEGAEQFQAKPPLNELPSGIVCYHIHSIDTIELPTNSKTLGTSKSSRGQRPQAQLEDPTGENSTIPSSYCYVLLNEEPVLRTRTSGEQNPQPSDRFSIH